MSIAGILVRVRPERYPEARAALAAVPGIDVFQGDPATGRIVVTLEAASVRSQVDGLERLRALPGVLAADLAYHRFDDDEPGPGSRQESP